MESERKRSPNYTYHECVLLLELVDKNKDILNIKRFDGESVRQKESVWDSITVEFNEVSDQGYRDKKELRSKYDNLKKTLKKKILGKIKLAEEGVDVPKYQCQMNPIESKVKDIIEDEINSLLEYERIKKISSSFGNDDPEILFVTDIIQEHDYTDIEQEVNTSPAAPDDAIEPNNEPSDCINNSTDEIAKPTFVQIRPKPLQKLTSILSDSKETEKKTNNRFVKPPQKTQQPNRPVQRKILADQGVRCKTVEEAKLELINIQVNIAREELRMQQRKREQMEEEHKLKIQILQAELKAKLRKC